MPSTTLSLAQLEAHDSYPSGTGDERRFLCPLTPDCLAHTDRSVHQSLSASMRTGLWYCHRCHQGGKLVEYWEERVVPPKHERAGRRPVVAAGPTLLTDPEPDPAKEKRLRASMVGAVPVSGTPGEAYLSRRGIPAGIARVGRV